MEVKRNIEPKNNFLRKIQNLAKKNIVLFLMNVVQVLERLLVEFIKNTI